MTTNKKWIVKGDEVGYISDHDDQSFGMFCPVSVVYDEEYARLIAAAPDLLEALLQIEGLALADEPRDLPTIAEIARAAIAKATGTSDAR